MVDRVTEVLNKPYGNIVAMLKFIQQKMDDIIKS